MTDFKGKTALVTGSTGGMGRATAMDAPFSLLDGLPRSTEGERESA